MRSYTMSTHRASLYVLVPPARIAPGAVSQNWARMVFDSPPGSVRRTSWMS